MALKHFIRVSIDSHSGTSADVCHYDEQGNLSGQDVIEVTEELAAVFNGLAGIVTEPAPEAESKPAPKRKTKKEK